MQIFTIINKRVMKSLIKVFIVISCLCVCSCSQYIHVMVSGQSGTVIKTPSGDVLGTIGSEGNTEINLPRNPHYAFLFSSNSSQGVDIPFALEFKTNTKKKIGGWIGYCSLCPTLFGAIPVGLYMGNSDVVHCYEYITSQTNEDLNIR